MRKRSGANARIGGTGLAARYQSLRDASDSERARWLFTLSELALDKLSPRDSLVLRWEALAFVYIPLAIRHRKYIWPLGGFPSEHDLRNLQDWLRRLWEKFAQGGGVKRHLAEILMYRDNRLQRLPIRGIAQWPDGFKEQVHNTLASIGDSFTFCHNERCRRPFLANKRQAYCSPSCSQAYRTHRYRTENPERFRTKRREAYARKQRERLGVPAIRIQSRQKGGKS